MGDLEGVMERWCEIEINNFFKNWQVGSKWGGGEQQHLLVQPENTARSCQPGHKAGTPHSGFSPAYLGELFSGGR